MSKKLFTLIDTTDNCGLKYEDYVEGCEINEVTPATENSDDYWEWISETVNMYIDDFFTNVNCMKNDSPVIITGSLGLWNGRKEIYPMLIESSDPTPDSNGKVYFAEKALCKAIKKCVTGMDDFKVEYSEGVIVVHGYHHDGTNIFEIHKLSTQGKAAALKQSENGKQLNPKKYWYAQYTEGDLY